MNVPFIDLHGQLDDCGQTLDRDVLDVLHSCRYILGDKGKLLEDNIAAATSVKHAIGVSSGTDALILAMSAMGLRPGRKVVVPAFTFCASVSSILFAGGEPYFVDVDEDTFNINIDQALSAKGDIAGYIPVHLYGLPAKIEKLAGFAKAKERFVLEDCAQAYGARLDGKPVGSIGDAGILSFYPTKNLSAAGEAGMILTNDAEIAKLARLMRNHGEEVRYYHSVLGRNCRLDEIQAAVLLAKIPHVARWNARRQEIAAMYSARLGDVGDIKIPVEPKGCSHVYNLYTIRTSKRNELRDYLNEHAIGTGIYYPVSSDRQTIFQRYVNKGQSFPVAEKLCDEVLSLPMFPHLSAAQMNYVIETVRDFFA